MKTHSAPLNLVAPATTRMAGGCTLLDGVGTSEAVSSGGTNIPHRLMTPGWLAIVVVFVVTPLHAFFGVEPSVPGLLNYQGRVTVSGTPFTGTGQFKFALVNKTGTVTYWSNDNTSTAGSQPTTSEPVLVANGLYSVQIGNSQPSHLTPNMTPLPASVFENNDVHLRIWFSDGVNGFNLITPDQRIGAVGYSLMAAGVTDASITSAKLVNGAVTDSKLAAGAVTAGKIAAGAVQGGNIAAGAVGNLELSDLAVSASKLRLGVEVGTIADGRLLNTATSRLNFAGTFSYPFTRPPTVTIPGNIWGVSEVTTTGFTAFTILFPSVLDSDGDVGEFASLAVIDGNPAVAYFDNTAFDLKYIRATSANGTTWGDPMTVATTAASGRFNSMLSVNGRPAIAYARSDLFYIRASDATGATWGTPKDVVTVSGDGGANVMHINMAVVDGRPAISYHDLEFGGLRYVNAFDADGSAQWNRPVSIPAPGGGATFNSLAVVDGLPAVAFHNLADSNLYFIRATNVNGTAWGDAVLVDPSGNVGHHVSMAIVDGFPAMAYYNASAGDLRYIRATEVTGTAAPWSEPVIIDESGSAFQNASLKIIAGKPAIAYYDSTLGDLKYVAAADSTGTAWNPPIKIDSTSDVGLAASLAEVDGGPSIAYHDVTAGDLKFTPIHGLPWRASDGTMAPVMASHVAEEAVGSEQMTFGAVTSDKIAAKAVTTAQIADGAVTGGQIASGSVGSAQIAAGAIGSTQLATGAVQSANIAAGAVQGANIADGSITSTQLASNAVQSSNIADGAITSTQLGANAVQSSNIAAGAITSTQLAKPPRSGQISLPNSAFDFGVATYIESFPTPFGNTPIVTQAVNSSIEDTPGADLWVLSADSSSFTGKIDLGREASATIIDDIDSEDGTVPPKFISMQTIGSRPTIAYTFSSSTNHFVYKKASNTEGTIWGETVHRPPFEGPFASSGEDAISAFSMVASSTGVPVVAVAKYTPLYDRAYVAVMSGDPSSDDGAPWTNCYLADALIQINPPGVVTVFKAIDIEMMSGSGGTPLPIIAAYQENAEIHKILIARSGIDFPYFSYTNLDAEHDTTTFATMTETGSGALTTDTTTPRMVSLSVFGDGMPAVIYQDLSGNLRFVRATGTQTDGSGNITFTLSPAANLGASTRFAELAIVNGNPAVVYVEPSGNDLVYRRATDASGTSWGSPITLDGGSDAIRDLSFVYRQARPQVAFAKQGRLRFVRANDSSGTSWRPAVTVDDSINQSGNDPVGSPVIVPTAAGFPRIGYLKKDGATDIKFIRHSSSQSAQVNWIALEP